MKLNKILGFVLLATLAVALSGNVTNAIPSGAADFSYVSFSQYFGLSTSLPVNPGDKDVVIGAFALKDCNGGAPFGPTPIGPSGSIVAAGLCTGAVAPGDGFASVVTQLDIIQVGGSAPAGTFTNVRAYVDTGTAGTGIPGLVGRGVFNKAADQLIGTFSGDVATGATLSCAQACIFIGSAAGRAIYIVADVSPAATVGTTAVIGLTAATDNRDLGFGIVNSSTTAGGIFPPVQSQIQVAIGAAQTGQARGIANDFTLQVNVVTNSNPTVSAGAAGQIAQIIGLCAAATSIVPAPRPGTVFVGTLYPACVNAAGGFFMVPQQLIIRKQAGTLPRVSRVHIYVDRNGNDVPDASEEIGQGFPWPDTSQPLVIGKPGNALLSGPPVGAILGANGALASAGACPVDNLLPGICGINLIITLDFDANAGGTLQINTEIIAGDIPRLGLVGGTLFSTAMPVVSPITFNVTGAAGGGTTATLAATVGKLPKKPGKSMTYKDVIVIANGPAGASQLLTGFSVPGCTVTKVKGPALPVNVTVGGAPVGPFSVKVKCATKPATVPGLTPLRAGGTNDVPSLIPLRSGSVGTVEIFTLTGKKVLETEFSNGKLNVNRLGLPNGVYLYVVKTITPEGVVQSEIRKFIVKN